MITAILFSYLTVAWVSMIFWTIVWSEGVMTFKNIFLYSAFWPYALALWITGEV